MRNLADIKNRINGIRETRQITSAMETISVAKIRKALMRCESNAAFFKRMRAVICDIVKHSKSVESHFLHESKGERAVFIVIASDKGMCGGYNNNVLNFAWELMAEKKEKYVFTVGQIAREYFEKRSVTVDVEFVYTTVNPSIDDAEAITDSVLGLFEQELMDEVFLVFTEMKSAAQVSPAFVKLLPLSYKDLSEGMNPVAAKNEPPYYRELHYEPSPDEVLKNLIPSYITGVIYGALLQSSACEHSSRMAAMSSATKNAGEILDKLSLQYHRARQEAITAELSEIITSSGGSQIGN